MLFDSTLRKELAKTFGVSFTVIITIVVTMMMIKAVGLAAKGSVSPQHVLLFLGYATLSYLANILSLSLFVAVVATLGRMYRDSEATIWFASGVGLRNFVRPTLRMAWPVFGAVAVLMLLIWPWGNQNSQQLREQFERRGDLSRVAPGQFQSSADGQRVFFIERDHQDDAIARNVFIMLSGENKESVTTASRGYLQTTDTQRLLVLEHGQRNEMDLRDGEKTLARFERYSLEVDEQVMRRTEERKPKTRSTLELLRERSKAGDGELAWRFGQVLGCVTLMLLGLGLAATNPRRASSWNLLFALLSFAVYFNLITLSESWVSRGWMGLPQVLLALHGGALLLALALIWWRDNANRLQWRHRAESCA
ncbi:LPS export ABC transporter permease LptF [Roseateles sp. BYS180W]|uniref:Lipopolysaccharide export system permease protein LptF n=1 Tax=Roseateles rivi TaxID=3299028 RepID=A0ABW7FXU3_9BURK